MRAGELRLDRRPDASARPECPSRPSRRPSSPGLMRGGLGLAQHRVRQRFGEQHGAEDDECHELDDGDEACDERGSPPGAEGEIRSEEWSLQGTPRFAGASSTPPASTPTSGRGRPRGSCAVSSRARAPPGSRRGPSGGRRRGAPASSRGACATPATAAHARCSSSTVVSRAVPMLNGPPVLPDGREQRVDDVADVDEVAHLAAVAEDDRLVAARHPLEEDRDDARPRVRRPGAGRRCWRSAARCGSCRRCGSSPRGTPRRTSSRCRTPTAAGTGSSRRPARGTRRSRRRPTT